MRRKTAKTPANPDFTPVPSQFEPIVDKTQTDDTRYADLLAQITALTKRLDQSEATNLALLSVKPDTSAFAQPAPAKLDLTGLPDPLHDVDGYNKGLADRVDAAVTARVQSFQTSQGLEDQQRQKARDMWDTFEERYSDQGLAENPKLVEFAALQVVNEAKSRGIDVERYMFATQDRFMNDVAEYLKSNFSLGSTTQTTSEPDDDTDDEDDGRALAMFGGAFGGATTKKGDEGEAGDMLTDLSTWQKKSGYF